MKKKKIPTLSENCKEYLTAWEFVFIFYARILRWLLCKIGNLLIYSPQITEIFMEIKDEKNEKNEKVMCGGAGSPVSGRKYELLHNGRSIRKCAGAGSGSDAVFVKNVGK